MYRVYHKSKSNILNFHAETGPVEKCYLNSFFKQPKHNFYIMSTDEMKAGVLFKTAKAAQEFIDELCDIAKRHKFYYLEWDEEREIPENYLNGQKTFFIEGCPATAFGTPENKTQEEIENA